VLYRNTLLPALQAILLLFSAFASRAQETSPLAGYGIETSYIGGKVFKHSKKFKAPIPDYSQAIDISLLQQTYGTKEWQQRRKYPLVGLGITYTDYGLDNVYGKYIGVYPILQFRIITGKKLEWTCRVGLGMGYATTHYRRFPDLDTINNAIGSHLNNFTMIATDLRYKINDQFAISIGGNFSHISNGVFKQPNLGVNMYGGHIALRYFPVTSKPARIARELEDKKNRLLVQARFAMAFSEYNAPDGPLYPIYITSAFLSKRYSSKNKAFAGLDYSYHPGTEAFLRNNEIFPGEEKSHSWKGAAFVGNEFLFGHFGLVLQLGAYIKEPYLSTSRIYQKLGYNFYLLQQEKGAVKEVCIYSMLKAHNVQAEFIEFGVGVSL